MEMDQSLALSSCSFITWQAAGIGIPSRCRQDVGGNTWKSWHRPEGLCKSSGSGATPLQSQSTPFPGAFSVGQLLQPSCRCSFPMWEGAASSNVSGNLEAASTARYRFASIRALPRCSTPGSFPRCHCFSHCPPLLGSRELVRLCGAAMCCCPDPHPYVAYLCFNSITLPQCSGNTHRASPLFQEHFLTSPGVSPHLDPEGST